MKPTPATSQPVPPSPQVLPITVPTKLAVIAPLVTTGPVTYETLLADLDAAPIPYQLWLLAQVARGNGPSSEELPSVAYPEPASTINPVVATGPVASSEWAVAPSFSPVSGVDATSVAWPTTETPRVVTVQYSGLEINQAINWAIRQAHGDMILVLDHGLSGLLQLRQALDEIRIEIQRHAARTASNTPADTIVPPAQLTAAAPINLGPDEEQALPGALNRRLVERLEQWGVAMQRQAARSRQQREVQANQPHIQPAQPRAITPPSVDIEAAQLFKSLSAETINRIDDENLQQPKKLPKFITHFHEFI